MQGQRFAAAEGTELETDGADVAGLLPFAGRSCLHCAQARSSAIGARRCRVAAALPLFALDKPGRGGAHSHQKTKYYSSVHHTCARQWQKKAAASRSDAKPALDQFNERAMNFGDECGVPKQNKSVILVDRMLPKPTIRHAYWWFQVLGWLFFSTYFLLSEIFFAIDGQSASIKAWLAYYLLGIGATHVYYRSTRKRQHVFASIQSSVVLGLSGSLLVSFLFLLLQEAIIKFILKDNQYFVELRLYELFPALLLIQRNVLPWFFCFHIYKYAQQAHRSQLQQQEMENLLKKAELDNLKSQLQPHFLFNALNSIKSLMISNVPVGREAVTQLADLLRWSLAVIQENEVPLQTELNIIDNYIFVEKLRYDERLIFEKQIEVNPHTEKIPPFAIQTLVENAVKHGIARQRLGGKIRLTISRQHHRLSVAVSNDGVFGAASASPQIGLNNLRKRLRSVYQNNQEFHIAQCGTKVTAHFNIYRP